MLVVDANVATKWFVNQIHSDAAEQVQASRQRLLAPQLLIAEVTDALRKHVRTNDVTHDQAQAALLTLPKAFSELVPMQALAIRALTMAGELEHSSYDCFYLALAETRSAQLVTADRRLVNRLASTKYKSHVVHLADWT